MARNLENDVLSDLQNRTELLLHREKEVMEMIATGRPIHEILITMALNFEANSKNAICSILLVAEDGKHLRHGAGPSLPDRYNEAIDGIAIGPMVGSCGTAVCTKERVIVSDIANDPLWVNYKELAFSCGLKACWSTPIIRHDDHVLGTFAIYYREVKEPDEQDFELIDRAANHVKIALEHHYQEAQLKTSEEKYRTSLDRITNGFVAFDRSYNFTYMNKKCGELLRRDPARVIGKHVFDEFPELLNRAWHHAVEKAIKEQRYVYLEDYNEPNDRWFEDHIYPSPEGISIYFRDITRRKKSEKELLNRELLFRRLASNVPNAIFQTGINGECTYVNEAWSSYSGLTSEEAIGEGWVKAIHPDDIERVLAEWTKAVKLKKDFYSELRFLHKDGHTKWLIVKAVALVDTENEIYGHIGMAADITERKLAEEELIRTQQEKEAILNRISDKMISVDNDWRYTFLNDAALEEHPLGRTKTLGKVIWDVHPEMIGTIFYEKYHEANRTKKTVEIESNYQPFNVWYYVKVYPSDDGLTIYYHDITRRKKNEEQIQNYTKKLRDLTIHLQNVREEERAALSRELHDELGQQLTAIKMDLSWMNNQIIDPVVTSKIGEAISLTNEAVSTVRRINSELRPSLLDNLGLFAALESQLAEFSKRYNIEADFRSDINEPHFEVHYSIAIFRIVQESLTNVARHANATKVNVLIRSADGKMRLTITDNGNGIDTNGTNKAKSFGILGMTERAMMMNGVLTVNAQPGEGTTVQLSIPLQKM